jgi:hypothetical protein
MKITISAVNVKTSDKLTGLWDGFEIDSVASANGFTDIHIRKISDHSCEALFTLRDTDPMMVNRDGAGPDDSEKPSEEASQLAMTLELVRDLAQNVYHPITPAGYIETYDKLVRRADDLLSAIEG